MLVPRADLDTGEEQIPAPAGKRIPVIQPVVKSLHWLSYAGSRLIIPSALIQLLASTLQILTEKRW
jgi:hypothetical protein